MKYLLMVALFARCLPDQPIQRDAELGDQYQWVEVSRLTTRMIDTSYGVVCYRYEYRGISCVKIDVGPR